MKKIGTSDAWSTSRLSHRPSEPVYHIVDWQILEVVMEEMTNAQLVRLDKRIDGQVYFFFQGFRHGYFAASNREG